MSSEAPSLVIAFVLDASSSMSEQTNQTISGVNEYVQNLKKDHEGKKVLYTLTKFDTSCQVLHAAIPIQDVPEFTSEAYAVSGMTALYDAVGETITELEKRIDADTPALVVILTDGGENASTKFNLSAIKEMITNKKENGWSFVFMGDGEDAWTTGEALGTQTSINYNSSDMAGTMKCVSAGTRGYSESRCRGVVGAGAAACFDEAYAESAGRGFDMNTTEEGEKEEGEKEEGHSVDSK